MENKDSGGGHGLRRILRAIVALIVSAATLLTGASTALATQADGLPGYWYNPASDGSGWFTAWHGTSLGVVTYEGDTPIYCIEAGIVYSGQGTWEPATDRDSKIAAFMVEQHKNDRSDMTQAAVAYAIHAHLDRGQSHFNQLNAVGLEGADINAVAQLANQLWNDASLNMPDNIQASYQYTQGKRKGTFDPGIKECQWTIYCWCFVYCHYYKWIGSFRQHWNNNVLWSNVWQRRTYWMDCYRQWTSTVQHHV